MFQDISQQMGNESNNAENKAHLSSSISLVLLLLFIFELLFWRKNIVLHL